MNSLTVLRHAVIAVACAAAVGLFPACGGDEGTDGAAQEPALSQPPASLGPALEGRRVSGRDEALQIVARGVVAPLYFSELAHAVLARAFELRGHAHSAPLPALPGDRWALALQAQALGAGTLVEGPVAVEIEAAHHAEGLILRSEAGFVRALLRFEQVVLGTAARVDGTVALEVSRSAAGAQPSRRSRADALSITAGSRTLNWSYLDIEVDAQQAVQTLNVLSDVPIDGSNSVWIDVTTCGDPSSRHHVASGVIGFLKARLMLRTAADGGWTIEIDNDKDDRADFVVQASAHEARALMLGL
jgi:hypothetical protein